MGVISLSYLFGDALARRFMGSLIEHGVSWRGVFFAAAGVMLVIFLANLLLLKESPREIGQTEPQAGSLRGFDKYLIVEAAQTASLRYLGDSL